MQVVVSIGQEPDFERLDQLLECFNATQHRRDHDQRADSGGYLGEVHSRQRMRRHQHCRSQFTATAS